jgi:hypothetical protein
MAFDNTQASDDTHESSLEVTHQVQLVVDEVSQRLTSRAAVEGQELGEQDAVADVGEVKAALRDALRSRGLPQQPEPWIDATATEIAGGRRLVIDSREEPEPDVGRQEGGRTSRDVEESVSVEQSNERSDKS